MRGGAEKTERGGARGRRIRVVMLAAIGLLYLLSVPWYRDHDAPLRLVLGLPDWVALAVLCYAAVAVLNSVAWWHTEIDDHGPLPDSLAAESREGPERGAS